MNSIELPAELILQEDKINELYSDENYPIRTKEKIT